MEIEKHKFKSQDGTIEFDAMFDNLVYVNATEQYQIFGKTKDAFSYFKINTLVPYAEKLISLGKVQGMNNSDLAGAQVVTVDDLIIVRQTGYVPALRGTWLHPKLAIVFARWLSDEFAIWCDEKIADLLANGIVTLRPEDRKWVDIMENLRDCKPGNASYMSHIYDALIIHETEGYNIRAFKDMIDFIRTDTDKEEQPKVFKKLRQLITDMYEAGELSRTSHESMLEICVDTVVEVLEKEVKSVKSKLRRITLKSTAAPVIPDIAKLTATLKAEADNIQHAADMVIDAQSLYCHKIFGLASAEQPGPVPVFIFGTKRSTIDCRYAIEEAGYRIPYGVTLYEKAYNAKENMPELHYRDASTNIGVGIWFNTDGSATCKISKSYKKEDNTWGYKTLLDVKLWSMPSVEPSFYTGTNNEGTIRVGMSTFCSYLMIYGTKI